MDASILQDRISRGMGTAARAIGFAYDAYRPTTSDDPLAPEHRFLRLHAAFNARDPAFKQASAYGRPAWFGVFDSAYTRPGDYLAGPGGTFFIAAQEHLLPPLCILTNATLTATRPALTATPGLHDYSGAIAAGTATATRILTAWPASVLAGGGGGQAVLPSDGRSGSWSILLPPGPYDIQTSDLLTCDLPTCDLPIGTTAGGQARTFVVGTAERTALGTRITATQAAA